MQTIIHQVVLVSPKGPENGLQVIGFDPPTHPTLKEQSPLNRAPTTTTTTINPFFSPPCGRKACGLGNSGGTPSPHPNLVSPFHYPGLGTRGMGQEWVGNLPEWKEECSNRKRSTHPRLPPPTAAAVAIVESLVGADHV